MIFFKRLLIGFSSSMLLLLASGASLAATFSELRNANFEMHFYDPITRALVYRWGNETIEYDPDNGILLVGRERFVMSTDRFPGFSDADLLSASIYSSPDNKKVLCFDFGFEGIYQSGSFQNIRGLLLINRDAQKGTDLFYLKGLHVSCAGLSAGGEFRPNRSKRR